MLTLPWRLLINSQHSSFGETFTSKKMSSNRDNIRNQQSFLLSDQLATSELLVLAGDADHPRYGQHRRPDELCAY